MDLLVLAVLQKRLPLGLCHCNDVRSGALTGNVGRFGIPVDPQRALAIHVLPLGSRRELKPVNGAFFRVAAIEGLTWPLSRNPFYRLYIDSVRRFYKWGS